MPLNCQVRHATMKSHPRPMFLPSMPLNNGNACSSASDHAVLKDHAKIQIRLQITRFLDHRLLEAWEIGTQIFPPHSNVTTGRRTGRDWLRSLSTSKTCAADYLLVRLKTSGFPCNELRAIPVRGALKLADTQIMNLVCTSSVSR